MKLRNAKSFGGASEPRYRDMQGAEVEYAIPIFESPYAVRFDWEGSFLITVMTHFYPVQPNLFILVMTHISSCNSLGGTMLRTAVCTLVLNNRT